MTATATERTLQQLVAAHLRINPDLVDLDQDLLYESGLDSVDVTTVLLDIEDAFAPLSLSDGQAAHIRSLRQLAAYIDEQRARVGVAGNQPHKPPG
jgi:acyl carrier protein